jgi:gamma-glutamylcyclotransferase
MNGDCWYFAYGSNLLKEQMRKRTGEVRQSQVCRLADHRLAFNKRKGGGPIYANIVQEVGAEVWGVAYLSSPKAMDALDESEGVETGHYHRQSVDVILDDGTKLPAVAYVANDECVCFEGPPGDEYLGRILRGAQQHGLSAEYIERIELLAMRLVLANRSRSNDEGGVVYPGDGPYVARL